jgi:NDP-sugar pyrophosphorylase family protein
MLPILGKPIVERVMENLASNGIDDFILVVSRDDRYITRYFRFESQIEGDIRFVYQPERLGMADALRWASPLIEEDFILSACDNLIPPQHITQMLTLFNSDPPLNAVLSLMRVPPEQIGSSGIVALEGDQVTLIVEKPKLDEAPSDIASLPLYCLSHKILDYLPEVPLSPRGEYELQNAIQMLIDHHGNARGLMTPSRLSLTRPADLLAINRHFLINGDTLPQLQPQTVGPNTKLVTPLHIEIGTVIEENCCIGPNVYIERDCRIGANSVIKDAILLREAVVTQGSQVIDKVVS